ncbi:MAG: ABC transporter ATP-binding protein/permease [Firmicutes bacterium]|nr:ABC transporter ATP-binding protein/permease [Bacillota bacterium]
MARNKFDVDEELEEQFNLGHLKRMFRYLKPHTHKLTITAVLMFVSNIAALLGPYLVMDVVDKRVPQKDIKGVIAVSILYMIAITISVICLKYRIRAMAKIAQAVILDIRMDIFKHLQKLPFSYYDSRPHGKILIRVVNYVNSLNNLLTNGVINLITDLLSLGVIVVYMLIIDVRLTFISLAALPLLMLVMYILKRFQRKSWQQVSRKQSNMNAYVHESICGIKVTQAFSREDENLEIFDECATEYKTAWMSAVKINHLIWPLSETISNMGVAFLYLVAISWFENGISVGVLLAFSTYITKLWAPIVNLGNFYNQIIISMAYMERIFELLDEPVIVANVEGAYAMPKIKGDVSFKHVGFSYDEGHKVLKDVTFDIKAGETVALVGATGCGKTTIVSLLSRFYNIQEGTITIDGHNISKVKLESLRKQMGVMMQDTFLFSGTIMDNIRYSQLNAADKEVMEAARIVKAHEFIMEFEHGYYTQVNERGSRLSVGQRQLISFARALLADPKILILDEATSSIDTKTEIALQQGLEKLLEGRTSFVVAHRLSTIKNADKIIYIDGGRIVEMGSHDALMDQKGAYYHLYSAQYKIMTDDRAG